MVVTENNLDYSPNNYNKRNYLRKYTDKNDNFFKTLFKKFKYSSAAVQSHRACFDNNKTFKYLYINENMNDGIVCVRDPHVININEVDNIFIVDRYPDYTQNPIRNNYYYGYRFREKLYNYDKKLTWKYGFDIDWSFIFSPLNPFPVLPLLDISELETSKDFKFDGGKKRYDLYILKDAVDNEIFNYQEYGKI